MNTPVMVNGLPGKMATEVARAILKSSDFALVAGSFTGPEITEFSCNPEPNYNVTLFRPNAKNFELIQSMQNQYGQFVSVDYTHPSVVNENADFYCTHNLPFVMGTTGGDRKALEQRVRDSQTVAVIAPNMAKQIVALQKVVGDFAVQSPDSLRGYSLDIVESHQQGKADTSGTAKAMVEYFKKMGIQFDASQIKMIRNPEEQRRINIPEESLSGHGWHTYTLTAKHVTLQQLHNLDRAISDFLLNSSVFMDYQNEQQSGTDGEMITRRSPGRDILFRKRLFTSPGNFGSENHSLSITHNVNGRGIYAAGTINALRFLREKVTAGEKGKVYSMIDVISS